MPLLKQNITNLIGGISQQPWHLRLPSQSQDEENTLASPVNGLMKRPPALFQGNLEASLTTENLFVTTLKSNESIAFLFIEMNGNYALYAMDGTKLKSGYSAYLDNSSWSNTYSANNAYRITSLGGETLILNRLKVVQWTSDTAAEGIQGTLIWLRVSDYNTQFKLFDESGNTVASYTTPDSWINPSAHDDPESVSQQRAQNTQAIHAARELYNDLLDNGYTTSEVTINDNVISVEGHYLTGDGGAGPNSFLITRGEAQTFEELPKVGINGYVCSIVRNPDAEQNGYWVKYEDPWVETVKPGTNYILDASTLPHKIVHGDDFLSGTLSDLSPIDWPNKPVGDTTDEFVPSFINKRINDIFFHRDRLGVLSEDYVVLSRIGDYFNFWRQTASQVLDDDPIDVSSTHSRGNQLIFALPYHQDLYMFSEEAQYILVGSNILSPYTVAITQSATFPSSPVISPIGVGQHVFFLSSRQNSAMVREYVIPGNQLAHKAPEITGHVPSLIPQSVTSLQASVNENMVAITTDDYPNRLYIYKYYEQDEEILQRAWNYWTFGSPYSKILNVTFRESTMTLLITEDYTKDVSNWVVYALNVPIETMWTRSLGEGEIPVHLDWRVVWYPEQIEASNCDLEYIADEYRTKITAPYGITGTSFVGVVTKPGPGSTRSAGEQLYVRTDEQGSTEFEGYVDGDITGDEVYFGYLYNMRYVMTTPTFRTEQNTRVLQQRVQLRQITLSFYYTGVFQVHVSSTGYRSYYGSDAYFGGPAYGSYDPSEEYPRVIEEGTRRIPVRAQDKHTTIEITSEHWTPCHFTGVEFEAWAYSRGQRV